MKKITNSLRAFLALVFCLVGMSAMAIDTVTLNGTTMSVTGTVTVAVEVDANFAGDLGTATFDLDAVLSILGISNISLADQYIVNVTDGECVENDGDAGYYDGWRDANGDAALWGSVSGMVCVKINTPSSGIIDYIGTIDTSWNNGDTYTALWGFIYEDKVAIVEVDLTFVGEEVVEGGVASMTMVGEQDIELEEYPDNNYTPTVIYPQVSEAASLLGCSTSALTLRALASANTFSASSTANQGGWWFDADGYVADYGSAPFFIEPVTAGTYTSLNVGQMPGLCKVGDVYKTSLYLVYEESYYKVNVTLNIVTDLDVDWSKAEVVSTQTLVVNQQVDTDYAWSDDVSISMDMINEAIGTTDPIFMGELSPEEAEENGGLKYTDSYTCDPNPGFWLTSEGYVTSWGTNSVWSVDIAVTTSDDELIFNCCQMPGVTADGDVYSGNFYLLNEANMKMMAVKFTYVIGESIEYVDAGSSEVTLYVNPDEELSYDIGLDAILESLGMTENDFMTTNCLTSEYGDTEAATGSQGLSFNLDGECVANGGGDVGFFVEDGLMWAYTQDEISEAVTATVYIQFGINRYTLYITFEEQTIEEEPSGDGPATMTQKGAQAIVVDEVLDSAYTPTEIYPDLTEAASLLGCSTSDLTLKALADATTFATGSTANEGGWWFDADGYVAEWGSAPFFIEPVTSGDYSTLNVGQMPGLCQVGDVYNTSLYLVYEESYYLVDVTLNIVTDLDFDWDKVEIVSTQTLVISQEYDEDYLFSEGASISYEMINEAIGTYSPTFLGEVSPDDVEGNGGIKYTDAYTCTPYPGFWLTSEGYVTSWGTNSIWSVDIAYETSDDELIFNCCQMPGATADGDVYTGTFYLFNEDAMKMMEVKVTYVIGDNVEYTNVGTSAVTLFVDPDEEIAYDFGMAAILEALGMTENDLMTSNCLVAATGDTTPATGKDGLSFDLNGAGVANGGGVVGIYIEDGKMVAYAQDVISADITATMYIQFGINRYTLNLTFTTDTAVALKSVEADADANAAIYDLAGRKVSSTRKGVYIQNGKKILVK